MSGIYAKYQVQIMLFSLACVSSETHNLQRFFHPGGGGGGSPLYRLYRYVPRQRAGGVRTTIAMHCGFNIFKMAAKVEKFRRLYALFFNRYSSFLR